MGSCLGGRRRIVSLLRKINDAIVRRSRGVHQRGELGEGFDRNQDGTGGQRGTGHAIRHPHGNRGRVPILLAEPDIAAMPDAAMHPHRLAMERMPPIVNRDLLSVVGRM
jgi:hypothetical protein